MPVFKDGMVHDESLPKDERDERDLQVHRLRMIAAEFAGAIGALGDSRELSLAKTKIEEAVMWARRHIEPEAPLESVATEYPKWIGAEPNGVLVRNKAEEDALRKSREMPEVPKVGPASLADANAKPPLVKPSPPSGSVSAK